MKALKELRNLTTFGCDLDGVVFDMVPGYLDIINRLTGRTYRKERVTDYSLAKSLGISKKLQDIAIDCGQLNIPYSLIPSAISTLHMIYDRPGILDKPSIDEIVFITGRSEEFLRLTTKELLKYFDPEQFTLVSQHRKEKAGCIRAHEIDYMVEDCLETANEIARHTTCKTFLFDYPWTQGETHKNIIRVEGWKEVAQEYWHRDRRNRDGWRWWKNL